MLWIPDTGRYFLSDIQVFVQGLVLLWLVIEDHDNLFVMSEFVHFAGIGALLWKLVRQRNSGGILPLSKPATAIVHAHNWMTGRFGNIRIESECTRDLTS